MATFEAYKVEEVATPDMSVADAWIRATVTYSTSTTATSTTVTISSVSISGSGSMLQNGHLYVAIDGESVGSWTNLNGAQTKTIGKSKTFTYGHSATTKTMSVIVGGTVRVTGGYYSSHYYTRTMSATKTQSVSIPARASYAVNYYANGGSGAPSSQTKWYGETLTLSTTKPYRSNYTFWHWNTSSTNAGTSYSAGASYTGNASLNLYAIWNPTISFDANGGSGAPMSVTKTYGQTLYLPSTKPQRTGYTFLGWSTSSTATSATYSAGGSYTSNSAATLYAVWRKDAVAPSIWSMSVVRCDQYGYDDDAGDHCRVEAYWSVDRTGAGMSSNTGTVSGTIRVDGSSTSRSITFSGGTSGTSGTATAIVPNCSTDSQYVVTVTVRNTSIGTGQSTYLSTSRSDILTRAFFTLDFAAGGRGVGMGVAAPALPDEGFECGFDAKFNGDVNIVGNVSAANLVRTKKDITNEITRNSDVTYLSCEVVTFGPFVDMYVEFKRSSWTRGSFNSIGTIPTDYCPDALRVENGVRGLDGSATGSATISRYGSFGVTPDDSYSISTTYYVHFIFVK